MSRPTKVKAGHYTMAAYGPGVKDYQIVRSNTAGIWMVVQDGSLLATARTLRGAESKVDAMNHRARGSVPYYGCICGLDFGCKCGYTNSKAERG